MLKLREKEKSKRGNRSFPFEDGKIVEVWEISDTLGWMQQLGMELKPKEGEK